MRLIFADYAVNEDDIALRFTVADPALGEPAEYTIRITEAEIASASTGPQLRALLTSKLTRQQQATVTTARLDALLGADLTI